MGKVAQVFICGRDVPLWTLPQYENRPTRPVRRHTFTEYRRERNRMKRYSISCSVSSSNMQCALFDFEHSPRDSTISQRLRIGPTNKEAAGGDVTGGDVTGAPAALVCGLLFLAGPVSDAPMSRFSRFVNSSLLFNF
ncbi:hypothetical protein EVAR_32624_1 [Eumeta japonica]|uniref:Uncharacterized protein n=1 Tax=Eumeta variegata TaxID=151549 RepID=A0A4C1WJ66_EUMVA|nr:hypothetical protein EVAR_32624_1 [Eumeta japonica]